jgi:hypothetical protein
MKIAAPAVLAAGIATAVAVGIARARERARLLPALPDYARSYADAILAASRATGVSPLVIAAVGDHETRWGHASGYTPKGSPAGTGDWTPRGSSWPYPMPPDGLGWGRGLMQLDYGAQREWHEANPRAWRDPFRNVRRGAEILHEAESFFRARGVTGDLLFRATLAAYNNRYYHQGIWAYMQQGKDPDTGTTRKMYSREVIARLDPIAARYA